MKIAVEGNHDKAKSPKVKKQDSFEDLLKHAQGENKPAGKEGNDATTAARAKRFVNSSAP